MPRFKEYASFAAQYLTYRLLYPFVRMDDRQVLFVANSRTALDGNQKAMDAVIDPHDYRKVYYLKKDGVDMNAWSEKRRLIRLLLRSKYVLLQYENPTISLMKRRPGQVVCQLWHGPGAMKRIGTARTDMHRGRLRSNFTHRNYTMALETSEADRPILAAAFNMDVKDIHAVGYPRTDVFFDPDARQALAAKVLANYPLLQGRKVVLFAPTFRGSRVTQAHYDYAKLDLDYIHEQLGKEYVFVIKWHPAMRQYDPSLPDFARQAARHPDFYLDLTSYPDINELMMVSDVLVTDYSSALFEFALLDRPIVLYPYDLGEYLAGRGFNYPYEDYDTGAIAHDCRQLVAAIKAGHIDQAKRQAFIQRFMSACDGHATQRTCQLIFGPREAAR